MTLFNSISKLGFSLKKNQIISNVSTNSTNNGGSLLFGENQKSGNEKCFKRVEVVYTLNSNGVYDYHYVYYY